MLTWKHCDCDFIINFNFIKPIHYFNSIFFISIFCEIFIKWDDTAEDDWLILIYIKDNSPDEGIIIEDKSNPEKHSSYEFKPTEIFRASDLMVDSLTKLLDRERNKKKVS